MSDRAGPPHLGGRVAFISFGAGDREGDAGAVAGAIAELKADVFTGAAGRCDVECQHTMELDLGDRAHHDVRRHVRRERLTNSRCRALDTSVAILPEPQVPRDLGRARQLPLDAHRPATVGLRDLGPVELELVDQLLVPGDAPVWRRQWLV